MTKMNESILHPDEESGSQPPMLAAISQFETSADAMMAVNALKQADFADEAISVRNMVAGRNDNEGDRSGSTITMVSVEAAGERAVEAWSILQSVTMRLPEENRKEE